MPTMALFDRGRHATSLPTHAHVTPPSLSKMQPTTTLSQQASTISSHPRHHPVQFLPGDTVLQQFTPPLCHCHLPKAQSQHLLPSSTELITVDPDTRWLYMLETAAKAVLTLLQQAPTVLLSTSHATHLLVQTLHTKIPRY
jgi:hypothetical protein